MTLEEFIGDDGALAAEIRAFTTIAMFWRLDLERSLVEAIAVQGDMSARDLRDARHSYWTLLDLAVSVGVDEAELQRHVEGLIVFGAGAAATDDGFEALVLTPAGDPERGPVPVAEIPELADVLRRAAAPPPAGTLAWTIPEPRPHFGTGTIANAAGARGTFGAPVTTRHGRLGILTAGHVGRRPANTIWCDEGPVGVVGDVVDPADGAAAGPAADVAVVLLHSLAADRFDPDRVEVAGDATAPARSTVTSHGGVSGQRSSTIFSFSPWVAPPSMAGAWCDVYQTSDAISQPGDSGAAVLREDHHVVGHVVGGALGVTSFVQDVHCQLAAVGAAIRVEG